MEDGDQRTKQPEFAKVFLIDRGQLFEMTIHLDLICLMLLQLFCLIG